LPQWNVYQREWIGDRHCLATRLVLAHTVITAEDIRSSGIRDVV